MYCAIRVAELKAITCPAYAYVIQRSASLTLKFTGQWGINFELWTLTEICEMPSILPAYATVER